VRSRVAGANAVLAPLALREQLTQLIPGFDASSGAVALRVAALPVAWKLAGAALSAGVVATGASGLQPQPRTYEAAKPRPRATRAVVATTSLPSRQTIRASVTTAAPPVVHRRRHRGREEHHAPREQEHSSPEVVETSNEGPEAAPARVEESHEGPGDGSETAAADDRSGEDGSGHGGGGFSGSDDGSSHSGPG
jgi:hypothetical protein